jgi:hypothetical protein
MHQLPKYARWEAHAKLVKHAKCRMLLQVSRKRGHSVLSAARAAAVHVSLWLLRGKRGSLRVQLPRDPESQTLAVIVTATRVQWNAAGMTMQQAPAGRAPLSLSVPLCHIVPGLRNAAVQQARRTGMGIGSQQKKYTASPTACGSRTYTCLGTWQ